MNPTIGQYQVHSQLGSGENSVVYLCKAPLGMAVAVKVFLGTARDDFARFQRERRILEQLGAAHGFVPLLDAGETERGPYLVMPYMAGGTLRARLEQVGALEVPEAVQLGRAVALALGHAHSRAIVHRDLKPENILYTARREPLIADLGLAKFFRKGGGLDAPIDSVTEPGEILGTVGYMAPEQLMSQPTGSPTDVFSLAAILYECLTSRPVFPGDNLADVVQALLQKKIEPIRAIRPEVPEALAQVIQKALAFDPHQRYRDGFGFALALGARPQPAPPPKR